MQTTAPNPADMQGPAILRPPGPGDVGWLISSHGKVYAEDFAFSQDFELDIARKVLNLYDNAEDLKVWIAEVDGRRVGSVAVSRRSEDMAFVNFLLVLNRYRGRGISTQLMLRVIECARQRRYKTLQLETYSCLTTARTLYRKLGFRLARSTSDVRKYGHRFEQEFWELEL
ncbi:MAG TPA: GNAT family N-acetyltransferase [Aromatoleum sp.]|uniref:GNAT family N-acetyltransferase n=1 Tax=Aromatoleum sp. TaxID=2307007 RepID=UPI002B49D2D1|nr:GNAT family N-acetyltransferase [Aromatoleum sp.]HJV28330.1 GNAT family N-acetyltransferase [Aromatoleum sp.]